MMPYHVKETLRKLAIWLVSVLVWVACVFLIIMMATVFIDVIGRYFFGIPIKGSNELISLLLAVTVFLCLPIIAFENDHIKVNLLERRLNPKFKKFMTVFSYFIMSVGLWVISEKIAQWADRFSMRNQTTMFMKIPLEWFAYLALFSCYFTILLLISRILNRKDRL